MLVKVALGCAVALAFLLVLPAALLGPLWRRRVERLARRGRWAPRRDLSLVPPNRLFMAWMSRSDSEAQEALSDAISALVALLPAVLDLDAVESLAVENPASGFVVSPERLSAQPITDRFGDGVARMLYGERVEYGCLIVNREHRLELDFDARSFVAGHFVVELPSAPPDDALAAARLRFEGVQRAEPLS
jgi:hypothetical protein